VLPSVEYATVKSVTAAPPSDGGAPQASVALVEVWDSTVSDAGADGTVADAAFALPEEATMSPAIVTARVMRMPPANLRPALVNLVA